MLGPDGARLFSAPGQLHLGPSTRTNAVPASVVPESGQAHWASSEWSRGVTARVAYVTVRPDAENQTTALPLYREKQRGPAAAAPPPELDLKREGANGT